MYTRVKSSKRKHTKNGRNPISFSPFLSLYSSVCSFEFKFVRKISTWNKNKGIWWDRPNICEKLEREYLMDCVTSCALTHKKWGKRTYKKILMGKISLMSFHLQTLSCVHIYFTLTRIRKLSDKYKFISNFKIFFVSLIKKNSK